MDFPIKHGDFPLQNVSSPEGSHPAKWLSDGYSWCFRTAKNTIFPWRKYAPRNHLGISGIMKRGWTIPKLYGALVLWENHRTQWWIFQPARFDDIPGWRIPNMYIYICYIYLYILYIYIVYAIISIDYQTFDYVHWIGLREMLQETPMILMVKTMVFGEDVPLEPIQWYVANRLPQRKLATLAVAHLCQLTNGIIDCLLHGFVWTLDTLW